MKTVRVFVSSPGDTQFERMRVERVAERLNGEFAGVALLKTERWEGKHYKAHATFQQQIPEARDCDIVIAILRHRLGTELPEDFAHMPDGEPYPSGTAYEILTAIEASKGKGLPDVYMFRFTEPPLVRLDDDATNRVVTDQWRRLKTFFAKWFQTAEGKFKLAFQTFKTTDEFEGEVELLLRTWLEEKILKGRSVLWPIDTKGSPFRGLAPFSTKHAPVFFGRARDITKAVDALKDASERGTAFLLIVGASGAGKSSLALAGLVPRLTAAGVVPAVDVWRVAVMRPGESPDGPVAALAARLFDTEGDLEDDSQGRLQALPEIAESDYATVAELTELLSHADETSIKPILGALDRIADAERQASGFDRPVHAGLLIVVDQLDELFGAQISEAHRAGFVQLLSHLVASGRVFVIATLRADLYERFLKEPGLLAMKSKGAAYDLAAPDEAAIGEIVRGPAAAAGLIYGTDEKTGDRLDERLLREIDRPDMLPLLQFTLDFLFEQRETVDGETRLTMAAYDGLGGLAGAIEKEAERAMSGLGKEEAERLPRLLRQLATPAQGGELGGPVGFTVRAVPLAEAAYDAPVERLVRALVDARILLSSGSEQNATIRLAHQRVLENWGRAKAIVAANAEFYRIREDVEAERRRWQASGNKRDLLIPKGLPLAEAETIAKNFPGELPPQTLGFIAASGRRARLKQRLTAAAAVLFAVLAVGAGGAGLLAWKAQQRATAEAARATAEAHRAESNFGAALDSVNALIFEIARGLRNVEGMRIETINMVLERGRATVERLAQAAPDNTQLLRTRSSMMDEFVKTYLAAGNLAAAAKSAEESLSISRRLAKVNADDPETLRDLSVSLEKVGDVKQAAGDKDGALTAYEEALAIRTGLGNADKGNDQIQRDLSVSLEKVGDVKLAKGDTKGALAAYEADVGIARRLADADKANTLWQRDWSVSLQRIGNVKLAQDDGAGALAAYSKSLGIVRELAKTNTSNTEWQRDVAIGLYKVAEARLKMDDPKGALTAYDESLTIRRHLAALDRGNSQWQRDVSVNLDRIGATKRQQGDGKGALAAYQEMLELDRSLAETDKSNVEWQQDLSVSFVTVGDVLLDLDDKAAALANYEEGLAIRRGLAEADKGNTRWTRDIASALERIGNLKRSAGEVSVALSAYEESLALRRALAATEPDNLEGQRAVSFALSRIGDLKRGAGDTAGSLAVYEEMLALDRRVAAGDENNSQGQGDVATSLRVVGEGKQKTGDNAAALAAFEESLGIIRSQLLTDESSMRWQGDLSVMLQRVGDLKGATGDNAGALTAYEEMLATDRALGAADEGNAKRQQNIMQSLEAVGEARRVSGDASGALANFVESLAMRRKVAADDKTDPAKQRSLAWTLDKVGTAKLDLKDGPGALAAYEEMLGIMRVPALADKENAQAQVDLVLGLWDIAVATKGERKNAAIDEAVGILGRLDTQGKLSDSQKGWKDRLIGLRDGAN
jgi:tetratricopeptide (TPR) repeat protein